MKPAIRLSLAALVALSIAACATTPPPEASYEVSPPSKRQLDAKTQLETGRRY